MTAQIPDGIFLDRRLYDVCGIHGIAPFAPQSLGFTPVSPHTACWRGHINRYRIYRRRLVLEQLVIWLGSTDPGAAPQPEALRGPEINGVQPRVQTLGQEMAENFYDRLHLVLPFTGGILAGRDFLREFYVHMGFAPAWKYQTVYEAIFDQGALQELRDVSEQVAAIRDRMTRKLLRPDLPDAEHADLLAWVRSTFRLDYDWGRWL